MDFFFFFGFDEQKMREEENKQYKKIRQQVTSEESNPLSTSLSLEKSNADPGSENQNKKMVFISHSHDDDHYAEVLFNSLKEEPGIKVWLDKKDIKCGDEYLRRIAGAIEKCDAIILLLTESTLNSEFVPKEVSMAIANKKKIFPIKIGDFTLDEAYKLTLSNIQIKSISSFDSETIKQAGIIEELQKGLLSM